MKIVRGIKIFACQTQQNRMKMKNKKRKTKIKINEYVLN